ncbi:MAG: 5'-3' exonuclease H3TH domain-containing protein, partial [Pseudomonadota bacterium]
MPDVFSDREGLSVNGVRGYLSYLLKVLGGGVGSQTGHNGPVTRCAVAFDESLTTCWRNRIYPDYKANRPPADENIRQQLDRCQAVTSLLGVPVLADLEFEADDFIATLARQSTGPVVIVSRDKDLNQLVDDRVRLLDPKDDSLRGAREFLAEFGFAPSLFPDYQALTGDSVDNIPGIRGIGPKAAGRLVTNFEALEDIYAAEDRWADAGLKAGSKLAERLKEERDQAFLFRQVLRLDDEVALALQLGDPRVTPPALPALTSGLAELRLDGTLGQAIDHALERFLA